MPSPVGRNGFDMQSDVYKMLQDYVEPVSEPKQSGSFKYLQEILQAEDGGMDLFSIDCNGVMPSLTGTPKHSANQNAYHRFTVMTLVVGPCSSKGKKLTDSIIDNVNIPILSK